MSIFDDDPTKAGLYDLKTRSDEDVVRMWLAERGMVAVERTLADELIKISGPDLGAIYDARRDRYTRLKQVAA